jgi:MFS family permease
MVAHGAADARSTPPEEVDAGDIAIGVIIGRTSEFFDFFVYAIASVLVFPRLVFPYVDPVTATLYSFGLFGLAFAVRPLGTAIFMAIERSYGRTVKMLVSLFMIGTSTVAVGFLPGYAAVGHTSALLLAGLRIGQGLAMGAAWDGMASLLAVNAPQNRRGWFAMLPQLGAPLGLVVASTLFAVFVAKLSSQDFFDWGWRYPFFVAFAINVVAMFARVRIVSTPEYIKQYEHRELEPAKVTDTVRAEGRNILIGTFTPMASFTLFHMVTVFPLSWVFLFTKQPAARFLTIEAIAACVGVLAIVASGVIADRVGRRTLLGITAGGIAAFSGFAPQMLDGGDVGETVFMLSGFLLLGLSFGQSSGAVASNFSRSFRYTGSALTTDLAWLFGAGFAPVVALALASNFGLMASGGWLLSGALVTLVALAVNQRIRDRNE